MHCVAHSSALSHHNEPCHLLLFAGDAQQKLVIRPVRDQADVEGLAQFGREGLGDESRGRFAPFEWDGPIDGLRAQLGDSIANHISKRDLHYVAEAGGLLVAQCFLWSVCDTIPELGIAVADTWQGKGVGKALLKMMELLARGLNKDASNYKTCTMLGWLVSTGVQRNHPVQPPLPLLRLLVGVAYSCLRG